MLKRLKIIFTTKRLILMLKHVDVIPKLERQVSENHLTLPSLGVSWFCGNVSTVLFLRLNNTSSQINHPMSRMLTQFPLPVTVRVQSPR
jgi:hypothetical protein